MRSLLSYRLKRFNRSMRARISLLAPGYGGFKTPAPLLTLEYAGRKKSRTLMIFLPGIDDLAEDFERRGFIHDMRHQRMAADAIAVDSHYGYYERRVIFERIAEDVVTVAHANGYEEIWLVGISLGGFGAASYAARHVAHISGVLLLAPYLGGKALVREIAQAGGVKQWEPGDISPHDFQRSLWAWFKTHLQDRPRSSPQIYLGYGGSDMFSSAHALLADLLPGERVFAIPGRHDWHTWKKIWRMFLAKWNERDRILSS